MNKLILVAIVAMSILIIISFARPAFAPIPVVQNVVAYNVGGSTFLNVTVLHPINTTAHYVNIIRVTNGANTTDLTIGPQPLAPDGTFTIVYNLGPISGNPAITVDAHCTINGWASTSGEQWTGQIPEFATSILMLVTLFIVSLAVLAFRKATTRIHE